MSQKETSPGGELIYADDALATIAKVACRKVSGLYSGATRTGGIIGRLTRARAEGGPVVKINRVKNRTVAFDIEVFIEYGRRITDVTAAVQETVTEELARLTNLSAVVNVHVRGIK